MFQGKLKTPLNIHFEVEQQWGQEPESNLSGITGSKEHFRQWFLSPVNLIKTNEDMKRHFWLWMILPMITIGFTSCSEDDEPEIPWYEVIATLQSD